MSSDSDSTTFESTSVESSTILVSHPQDSTPSSPDPVSEPTHLEPTPTTSTSSEIPPATTPITLIDTTTTTAAKPSSSHSRSPSISSSPSSPSNNGTHALSNAGQDVILYAPPTVFTIFRSAAINLLLPFINGLMLGFGELFAHEIAFRFGWGTTRVFPQWRATSGRPLGPGVEFRDRARAEDAAWAEAEKAAALD